MSSLPILYSFRRCPYAMRARMAVAASGVRVELREVVLRNKPASLLAASAKGTVPVLVLSDGQVLDESIDIMRWALQQHDPDNWLGSDSTTERWVSANDNEFKHWLDRYKYADRHPQHTADYYRTQGEQFLATLEQRITAVGWLAGTAPGMADIAVFPFVRQFAGVDPAWFTSAPYPRLRQWLEGWTTSQRFAAIMAKVAPWSHGDQPVYFAGTLEQGD